MPALPNVGSDVGIWGTELNNYLLVGHDSGGHHSQWFNVKEYGATGNGTTDDTTALQTAINDANAAGGGLVYLPAGVYLSGTLTIYTNVWLLGAGIQATRIKAKNSLNAALIQGANFATLTGTNNASAGIYGWGIENLCLDGNGANNTSGQGIQVYGFGYTLANLLIANTAGDGIYSEFATAADASPAGGITAWGDDIVAHLTNVRCLNNGTTAGNGINWYGPHDSVWHGVDSVQPLADSGYAAINIRNISTALGGPVQMVNCHGTGASWALRTESVVITSGCQWEQGARACVKYTGSGGSNQAANSVMNGDYIFCGGSIAAPVGIELGDTSPSVAVNVLNLHGSIFNCTTAAVKFTNDGGSSVLDIVDYQTSGNLTSGTRHAATQLNILAAGSAGTSVTRVQPHLVVLTGSSPTLGSLQSGISSQSVTFGNDTRGTVEVITTASPPGAFAVVAIVTFAQAFSSTPIVIVQGQVPNFGVQNITTTGFQIVSTVALGASATYFINFLTIG